MWSLMGVRGLKDKETKKSREGLETKDKCRTERMKKERWRKEKGDKR